MVDREIFEWDLNFGVQSQNAENVRQKHKNRFLQ